MKIKILFVIIGCLEVVFFLRLAWSSEWKMIGPGGGGALQCITAVKDSEGKSAIYVGGDVSGVWRRTIDGQWKPVNYGLVSDFVNDIVVDPKNMSRIFAATRRGVCRSDNSGDNWKCFSFSHNRITSVLGINSEAIYSATKLSPYSETAKDSKLHVSYDNGESWILLRNFGSLWISSIKPISKKTILVGTFSGIIRDTKNSDFKNDGGVFLSKDGGKSWKEVNGNLPVKQVFDLVVDREGVISVILPSPYGIWQSENLGVKWTPKNQGLFIHEDFYQLYVNPHDGKTLFLTAGRNDAHPKATGIWRFNEKKIIWERLTRIGEVDDNVQKTWNYRWVKADANAIVVDPVNPNRIFYVGRTIHRSDDGGQTWVGDAFQEKDGWWRNTGHCENFVYYIKRHPVNKNLLFYGDQDWRIGRSIDGGIRWQMTATDLPWGMNSSRDMIFDVENNIIYAAVGIKGGKGAKSSGKVIKSRDDGISWSDANKGLPNDFIRRINIDLNTPKNQRVLYALCINKGLYKSDDGGNSWYKLDNASFSREEDFNYLDIDLHPEKNGVIYICLFSSVGKGGLYMGSDYGKNWKKINRNGPVSGFVDLVIKPDEPNIMIATSKDGLYRTDDGGIYWNKVFSLRINLGIINSAVAFDPSNPNSVYAGASSYAQTNLSEEPFQNCFLHSGDAGKTWKEMESPIGGGMSRLTFIEVQQTGEIFVGTSGFGGYIYYP